MTDPPIHRQPSRLIDGLTGWRLSAILMALLFQLGLLGGLSLVRLDFPNLADSTTVKQLAKDPNSAVRIGAAQAIGYGQLREHLNLLATLLRDPEPMVSAAAAMSLLSFPIDSTKSILETNIMCGDP